MGYHVLHRTFSSHFVLQAAFITEGNLLLPYHPYILGPRRIPYHHGTDKSALRERKKLAVKRPFMQGVPYLSVSFDN